MYGTRFFFFLLVAWLVTQVFILSAKGVGDEFAIALTLMFGWLFAVPSIAYLVASDLLAKRFSFPWNIVAYLLLVVGGCGLYLATWVYWKGGPAPARPREWLDFLVALTPSFVVAACILVRRLNLLKGDST